MITIPTQQEWDRTREYIRLIEDRQWRREQARLKNPKYRKYVEQKEKDRHYRILFANNMEDELPWYDEIAEKQIQAVERMYQARKNRRYKWLTSLLPLPYIDPIKERELDQIEKDYWKEKKRKRLQKGDRRNT